MKISKVLALSLTFSLVLAFVGITSAADVPRITKEKMKAMLDDPEVVIIDVRSGRDWKASESKIKGAVREEPWKAKSWADKYDKDKTYLLYCA